MLKLSPTNVYRSMTGDIKRQIKKVPAKDEIQNFWGCLWGQEVRHDREAPWIRLLKEEYCAVTRQEKYLISNEVLKKIIQRM